MLWKRTLASDPIPVGALGVDGIMTSPHEVAHFVKQSGRHTNPRGLGHAWSLVSRGVERLWAMILHMADLPETGLQYHTIRQICLLISG